MCTNSDERGRFELLGLEPIGYRVAASARGFAPGRANDGRPVFVSAGRSTLGVDIVLETGGVELSGVVIDALGGSVAGASVRAIQWEGEPTSMEIQSDGEGRFAFWGRAGAMTLIASAEGYAPAHQQRVAPSRGVELVLIPGSSVQGIVVRADDNAPVADAEVRAYMSDRPRLRAQPTVRSGSDGQFSLHNLEQGEYVIEATGRNYRGRAATLVSVGLADHVTGVAISVSAAAELSGRVIVGSTRTPCEEGMVSLGPPARSASTNPQVSEEIQRAMAASAASGQPRPPSLFSEIGPDGAVHFGGVPQGQYFVTVECRAHNLRQGPSTISVGAEPISGLEWQVERGLGLSVLVVDEDRQPVPGARFALVFPASDPGGSAPRMWLTANARGRYDTPTSLYPGNYRVVAPDEAASDPVDIVLRDGMGATEVVLVTRGNSALLIIAQTAEGAAVDGLEVEAAPVEPDAKAPDRASPARHGLAATPIGDGQYRVSPLRPGRYRVDVNDGINPSTAAKSGGAAVIEVLPGRVSRTTVVLQRGAEIHGRVVGPDGQPLADVLVNAEASAADPRSRMRSLTKRREGAASTLTNAEGRFTIDRLAPGARFNVRAEQPGGSTAVARNVATGNEIEIVLRPRGTIRGLAVDARAVPIKAFTVNAVHLETGERRNAQFSSSAGRFVLEGVAPGTVELTASDANRQVAHVRVEVGAGQTLDSVRLELQPLQIAQAGMFRLDPWQTLRLPDRQNKGDTQ